MANARIVAGAGFGNTAVVATSSGSGPKTDAVVLTDGDGNIVSTIANGDGTATLAATTGAATLPAATVMQNAATGNADGTSLNVSGFAVAVLSVTTPVAMSGGTTVNFEASTDNATWVSIAAHSIGVNGSLATTTTISGDYRIAVAGYKSVRARISGYSAGTVTVKGYVAPAASQPTCVSLAVPAATGTPVALTGANQLVNTGTKPIRLICIRETTGTAGAVVRVYNNTSAAGTFYPYTLGPNESRCDQYLEGGIPITTGVYVSIVSGTIEGTIILGA